MKIDRLVFNSKNHSDNLIILILVIFISRVPFLFLGYGSDGDAWRIAYNASKIWETGTYSISRFPGFPLYELTITPFVVLGGSVASNIATLVVFCFTVVIFNKILVHLNIASRAIILWTFAFMPILWKNSATTLDYIWGLTFILFAYLLFLQQRYYLSAIIIGLTAATRLTHIIFVLPFFFLMEREKRWENIFKLGFISLITTILCYLPVILRPVFLDDLKIYIADIRHYSFIQQASFFLYRGIYSIGLPGFIAILVYSFLSRNKIKELFHSKNKNFISILAVMILMLVVFFLLADEREYLIPAIPFILLSIGMVFSRKYVVVASVCFLSYAFINIDFIEHNFGKQKLRLSIGAGYVVKDYTERMKLFEWRKEVASYPYKDSSIIMIGLGPIFFYENPLVKHTAEEINMFPDRRLAGEINIEINYPEKNPSRLISRNVFFVYALSKVECDIYKKQGYNLYYLRDKKEYLQSCVNYELDAVVDPLDIEVPKK
jgi:hypothetical protein